MLRLMLYSREGGSGRGREISQGDGGHEINDQKRDMIEECGSRGGGDGVCLAL